MHPTQLQLRQEEREAAGRLRRMGTAEPIIQILCVRSCKWLRTFIQWDTEWFKGNVTFVSTTSNVSLVARQASNISTLSVYVRPETCPQGDRLVGGFPFHACGRIRMRAKDATSASIANDENSTLPAVWNGDFRKNNTMTRKPLYWISDDDCYPLPLALGISFPFRSRADY